jgi:3-oxoacyl-[acyl-carrier protein] reductase
MDLGLDGRTAVVCASTSGLGRAVAEALAAEGARVVVSGRRQRVAEQIAAGLPQAVGVGVDLLAADGPQTLVAAAEAAFGPVDVLVLNGPGPRPARVTELEEAELAVATDSLVTVHHRLITATLPQMRARGWGRILAVGSSAVVAPIRDLALSGIGRTALAAYLKMLATEVAPDGVTANLLLPGRIDTDRVRRLDAAQADRTGQGIDQVRDESLAQIPVNRYGRPEEFGAVAAFLCSDLASYVTGTAVRCDGGQSSVL